MFTHKTFKASAILAASLALIASAATSAQETDQSTTSIEEIEEITVLGTRGTIQRSIDLKRNSTQIVDGLSAEEIGEIPALSIGAALETITGATSHRENGGATELSVRGLGPFLGTTVINGREATNGGGNRAVNFSIFPSEMFNQIAIHKTQSAEYIEGAVSGQIRNLDHAPRLRTSISLILTVAPVWVSLLACNSGMKRTRSRNTRQRRVAVAWKPAS